jgi:hypothetical protein
MWTHSDVDDDGTLGPEFGGIFTILIAPLPTLTKRKSVNLTRTVTRTLTKTRSATLIKIRPTSPTSELWQEYTSEGLRTHRTWIRRTSTPGTYRLQAFSPHCCVSAIITCRYHDVGHSIQVPRSKRPWLRLCRRPRCRSISRVSFSYTGSLNASNQIRAL